ncbi:hypothetical protein NDU88_008511 [Pleurodeles waltl]|uniref:Uncharacterized protein n=1 Tax=Pleurodeles waltl TaxID=8319 RepID=A0AAV7PPZ7_PLEWA|nr:hypothetical protein NDU88_008511 [Pleurodeles waltl]
MPGLTVTLRPGSSNAGPKEEEKVASGEREEIMEKEESGFERVQACESAEEEETAGGGTKSAVAPGGGARNPATLLEKRGKTRSVFQ